MAHRHKFSALIEQFEVNREFKHRYLSTPKIAIDSHYFRAELKCSYELILDTEHLGTVKERNPTQKEYKEYGPIFDVYSELLLTYDIEDRWPGLRAELKQVSTRRLPKVFVHILASVINEYFANENKKENK